MSTESKDSRPKILIVTELFPNPGHKYSGSFVVAQLEILARDYEIEVIMPYYVPLKRIFSRPGKKVVKGITVNYISWYAYDLYLLLVLRIISYPKLKELLKKRSVHALQKARWERHRKNPFHLVHGHEAYAGDEAGPIGKMLSIPSVVTIHGLFDFHQEIFGRESMQIVLKNLLLVDRIIAVSTIAARSYQANGLNNVPITVIPNGVSPAEPGINRRKEFGINDTSLVLLSVGTFAPTKRFVVSIHALKYLHDQGFVNSHLFMVGRGPERDALMSLVHSLGCRDFIHWLGEINPSEMGAVYRSADVLLHPSLVDSFSMVCLEAMSYGVPVICTDAIGIVEFINQQEDAVVVPADDESAFLTATYNLARSPEHRARLAKAGRVRASKLSWNHAIDQLRHIYQDLLHDHVKK